MLVSNAHFGILKAVLPGAMNVWVAVILEHSDDADPVLR